MAFTLVMIALMLLMPTAVMILLWSAEPGYEDEHGFHFGTPLQDEHTTKYDPVKPNRWLSPHTMFVGAATYAGLASLIVWLLA